MLVNVFVDAVKELTAPTLAKVVINTEVKMNKKDVETKAIPNPYIGARKFSVMNVTLNPKYETAVNDQREAEGKEQDFKASARAWGVNIGNGLVDNNGKLYISMIVEKTIDVYYEFEGELIEKSKLEPFMPKVKPSTNQGLEKTVTYLTVAAENIVSMELI